MKNYEETQKLVEGSTGTQPGNHLYYFSKNTANMSFPRPLEQSKCQVSFEVSQASMSFETNKFKIHGILCNGRFNALDGQKFKVIFQGKQHNAREFGQLKGDYITGYLPYWGYPEVVEATVYGNYFRSLPGKVEFKPAEMVDEHWIKVELLSEERHEYKFRWDPSFFGSDSVDLHLRIVVVEENAVKKRRIVRMSKYPNAGVQNTGSVIKTVHKIFPAYVFLFMQKPPDVCMDSFSIHTCSQ